jgi:Outer membrane protein beta-barrel domain
MHKILFVLVMSAVLTGAAVAQVPTKGNVYFGYAYERLGSVTNDGANANGWDAAVEGKFLPWIGLVADLNGNHGSQSFGGTRADISEHNILFGPRVSMQVGRIRPFAHLLLGFAHISRTNGLDSDTSFANGLGGGVDYRLKGPVSWRGQVDWINTRFYGHGQNDLRMTTGIAFHF